MVRPYTTGAEGRQTEWDETKYPFIGALMERIQQGYEAIKALRWHAPRVKGLYPMMLFMAEAAIAAHGYLIWPSVARPDNEKNEDDQFTSRDW